MRQHLVSSDAQPKPDLNAARKNTLTRVCEWVRVILLVGPLPVYLEVLSRAGLHRFADWGIPLAVTGIAILWYIVSWLRGDQEFRELLGQGGIYGFFCVPVGVAWLYAHSFTATFADFWMYGKWLLVGGEALCLLMLAASLGFERLACRRPT